MQLMIVLTLCSTNRYKREGYSIMGYHGVISSLSQQHNSDPKSRKLGQGQRQGVVYQSLVHGGWGEGLEQGSPSNYRLQRYKYSY